MKGIVGPEDDLFNVRGLNPERGKVFWAAFDDFGWISIKEYYSVTGSVTYRKKQAKERERENIMETLLRILYKQNKSYFSIFGSFSIVSYAKMVLKRQKTAYYFTGAYKKLAQKCAMFILTEERNVLKKEGQK